MALQAVFTAVAAGFGKKSFVDGVINKRLPEICRQEYDPELIAQIASAHHVGIQQDSQEKYYNGDSYYFKSFGGAAAKVGSDIMYVVGINSGLDPVQSFPVMSYLPPDEDRYFESQASVRKSSDDIVLLSNYMYDKGFYGDDSTFGEATRSWISSLDAESSLSILQEIAKSQILGFEDLVTPSNAYLNPKQMSLKFPDADTFTMPFFDMRGYVDHFPDGFLKKLQLFIREDSRFTNAMSYRDRYFQREEGIFSPAVIENGRGMTRLYNLFNAIEGVTNSDQLYASRRDVYPDLNSVYNDREGNDILVSWFPDKYSCDSFCKHYGYQPFYIEFEGDAVYMYLDINNQPQAKPYHLYRPIQIRSKSPSSEVSPNLVQEDRESENSHRLQKKYQPNTEL